MGEIFCRGSLSSLDHPPSAQQCTANWNCFKCNISVSKKQVLMRQRKMKSCFLYLAFFVFAAIRGTLGCDRYTGPAGLTQCFLNTPYYSKYQCATCLTNVCIKQRSQGQHYCRNRTDKYCYYQCMLEKYGIQEGPVYDDCLCDENVALPQPSVVLSPSCYSPDGSDCNWYRECLNKMFRCTGQAEYAISHGEKFCNLYEQRKSWFSQKGQQWIDAARKCLQVALVPVLRLCRVRPTCEEIRTKAFDSHVPCYVSPYQGFSVCEIEFFDFLKIFWTIKSSYISSAWLETLEASAITALNCNDRWTGFSKHLYSIRVWVQKNFDKRSVSDNELAHSIVLEISSSLQWDQTSTMDWYVFAANTSASTSRPSAPGRELTFQLLVVDRVDIGLLNITQTTGRRRMNETIAQLSDVIQHGLTGNVGKFRFHVMSLRQCSSVDGVKAECSNETLVAKGPPISGGFSCKIGTSNCIVYFLLAVMALVCYCM